MCRHFGAASCSKWQQLYTDVVCVHLGLKPSLLLDYLKPDAKKLQLLLQEVQVGTACPLSSDLIILKIGEDVFLVKTQSVAIPHNGRDSNSALRLTCSYVNITKGIKSLSLLSDDLVVGIEQEFEHWWRGFNHRVHQSRADDAGIPIWNSGYSLSNHCSLFGKLLGYPVVYWFDPEQGYSLEMVNLICHSVTLHSPSSPGIKPATIYTLEKVLHTQWQYSFIEGDTVVTISAMEPLRRTFCPWSSSFMSHMHI